MIGAVDFCIRNGGRRARINFHRCETLGNVVVIKNRIFCVHLIVEKSDILGWRGSSGGGTNCRIPEVPTL